MIPTTSRRRPLLAAALLAAGAALLAVPSAARAQSAMPAMTATTGLGPTLVDARGMTLYTFDRDTAGTSACTGQCATNWPPLMAATGASASGDWSLVTREGGSQWAYKGKPLYTWARDTKAGDTTGDGFLNGAWHAAKP